MGSSPAATLSVDTTVAANFLERLSLFTDKYFKPANSK